MKNKEIEELLNMLKKCAREDKATLKLNEIACKTILSYIEQLKKELKEEQEDNYKQSQLLVKKQKMIEQLEVDYKEAIESVTWWRNRFNAVERDKKQLENNRDKAIEVIDLITPELWNISNAMTYKLKDIKYILKGDSDE